MPTKKKNPVLQDSSHESEQSTEESGESNESKRRTKEKARGKAKRPRYEDDSDDDRTTPTRRRPALRGGPKATSSSSSSTGGRGLGRSSSGCARKKRAREVGPSSDESDDSPRPAKKQKKGVRDGLIAYMEGRRKARAWDRWNIQEKDTKAFKDSYDDESLRTLVALAGPEGIAMKEVKEDLKEKGLDKFTKVSSEIVAAWRRLLAAGEVPMLQEPEAARDEASYQWLRVPKLRDDPKNVDMRALQRNLKKLYCKQLQLPDLGRYPKRLDQEGAHRSVMLTEQLTDTIVEFVADVRTEYHSGRVLVGPHGVSKSTAGYVLASLAYVNGLTLLYYPLLTAFVRDRSDAARDARFLRGFLELNDGAAGVVGDEVVEQIGRSLKTLDGKALENARDTLMQSLTRSKVPVLYLFDEHNDIFEKDGNGNVNTKTPWLNLFKDWLHPELSNGRVHCYFIGSAHSQFLENIKSGYEHYVRHFRPLTTPEFESFLKLRCSAVHKLWKKNELLVQDVTGRVPHETELLEKFLREGDDFEVFEKERTSEANNRFQRLVPDGASKDTTSRFAATMDRLFDVRITPEMPGELLDRGLVYKDQDRQWCITTRWARQMLLHYYARHADVPRVSAGLKGSGRGMVLEAAVIRCELLGTIRDVRSFTDSANREEIITHRISCVQGAFKSANDVHPVRDEGAMFIPKAENFAYIDFIVAQPPDGDNDRWRIDFVQVTTDEARKHIHNSPTKQKKEYGEVSLCAKKQAAQYLDKITGKSGHRMLDVDQTDRFVINPKHNPSGGVVRFLYYTATSADDSDKQEAANAKWASQTAPEGVYVIGREELERCGVVF